MAFKQSLKKSWNFLQEDNWKSWIVSLILLIILIKFIFFPVLSFITSSPLPLVVVESCSMYHESSFDDFWLLSNGWYENHNISKTQFEKFPFKNGLNKGDIIFVWGRSEYKKGNIIIFEPNLEATAKYPVIHRLVTVNPYGTKGDNPLTNKGQLTKFNNLQNIDETSIPSENIIGKSAFKIPLLGWIKLIFFEPFKKAEQKGFCK